MLFRSDSSGANLACVPSLGYDMDMEDVLHDGRLDVRLQAMCICFTLIQISVPVPGGLAIDPVLPSRSPQDLTLHFMLTEPWSMLPNLPIPLSQLYRSSTIPSFALSLPTSSLDKSSPLSLSLLSSLCFCFVNGYLRMQDPACSTMWTLRR